MLSEYLDWNTFALGEIVFKNQIATSLSGKNSGSAEVALADGSQNVRMEFSLDSSTGRAYWYMRSVDPSTADGWPVDPYAGFLPPNDGKGNGEGYVAYRIRVRDDAPADAVINSSASIVFDYNEPMLTIRPGRTSSMPRPFISRARPIAGSCKRKRGVVVDRLGFRLIVRRLHLARRRRYARNRIPVGFNGDFRKAGYGF